MRIEIIEKEEETGPMTFGNFFSKAAKNGIISQFQDLNLPPDIIIEHCGKHRNEDNIELYEIRNKHFDGRILIKYNNEKNKYYASEKGDYTPDRQDEVIPYIEKKFNTEKIVRCGLEDLLKDIAFFEEKLKDFGNTEPLMEYNNIEFLNQIYRVLNIPDKEIVVDKSKPYATWMIARFFIVPNLDEIKQWLQEQIEFYNGHSDLEENKEI